jgi:carboxypeptidase Q
MNPHNRPIPTSSWSPVWAALLLLCACAGPATPGGRSVDADRQVADVVDAGLAARAEAIFDRALSDNEAIGFLQRLVDAAPNRLSGSAGDRASIAHTMAEMRRLGLQNVTAQPVMVPHWRRGEESAAVLAPVEEPLRITALGGSVATPADGLEGEVIMVRTFEQLRDLGSGAAGKIVFFNRPMPRVFRRTFQAYGEAVPQRTNGAVQAAMVGAKAAIVRSMTTTIDGYPHTGAMSYQDGVDKVPAAAIATADAERLAALCRQGEVRVRMKMSCESLPDAPSANVIGDLVGRELPEEIVLIGAHRDSWDLGQGAHDDGAGCAHVLEAMRLLVETGIRPRRTIRAVLFANEENGLRGGEAYAAELGSPMHRAAIETDTGGFSPVGFTCSLRDEAAEQLRGWFLPLAGYDAGAFLPGGRGGADIGPLMRAFPTIGFGMLTQSHRYFDYHHSAADTIDKVNERELAMGAAALAYAASVLADRL